MYAMTVEYTDYNGEQRTETKYFNLNKAETIELQISKDGGMDEYLKKIVAAKDMKEVIKYFKKLLLASYGEKTDDGKGFRKSDELRQEFENSAVYPEIYMRLATDDEEGARFVNGIMPAFEQQPKTGPIPVNHA